MLTKEIKMSKTILNLQKLQKAAKNSTKNESLYQNNFILCSLEEMQRDGKEKM